MTPEDADAYVPSRGSRSPGWRIGLLLVLLFFTAASGFFTYLALS